MINIQFELTVNSLSSKTGNKTELMYIQYGNQIGFFLSWNV